MPTKRKSQTKEPLSGARKKVKPNNDTIEDDTISNPIVGGMKGGFRVSGDEPHSDNDKSFFKVPFNDKDIVCERHNAPKSKRDEKPALIFTHGAGGGISNPATVAFADGFSQVSPVVCFQGNMNLKSRVKTFHTVVQHEKTASALGGRSMGARAAVMTALESEEDEVKGLILVSYPLVGAGKGDLRDTILKDLGDDVDVLFITGSEDSMCDIPQLNEVRKRMTAATWLIEVKGADHGMSLKSKKGIEPVRQQTGVVAAKWLQARNQDKTYCFLKWSAESGEVVCSGWTSDS